MTGTPGRRGGLRTLWFAAVPLALLIGVPFAALLFMVSPADWWAQLQTPAAGQALVLTLTTTSIATVACVVLGLPVAYLLARRSFRGKSIVEALFDLPVIVPPVVVGLALLLAFGRQGWIGRYLEVLGFQIAFSQIAVVLAQTVMASPFFVRTARAGFEAVDERLEHAAWSLGASPLRTFWTVSVPLAMPALFAGALLAWARALSEFGATIMFAGNFPGRTQTLSLAVMSAMQSDMKTAVAISILALGLGVVALFTTRWIVRRSGIRGI